ncbi:Rph3al, partial [Columba livia]
AERNPERSSAGRGAGGAAGAGGGGAAQVRSVSALSRRGVREGGTAAPSPGVARGRAGSEAGPEGRCDPAARPQPGAMADTIFSSGTGQWVCPNDRQLALRAKLQTGWSVHTFQTEKQRKMQALSPQELEVILEVIRKAERLDIIEQQRIGRLVERLENMRKNTMGNGLSQCLLCGELLGLLGSTSVFCQDCKKKVCTKCGIETFGAQKRHLWLCKICSEQREVWKRSGAWFYKGLPKYIKPLKSSGKSSEPPSQPWQSEPAVPEAESVGTSRSFTWARGKAELSGLCRLLSFPIRPFQLEKTSSVYQQHTLFHMVSSDSESDSEFSSSSLDDKSLPAGSRGSQGRKHRPGLGEELLFLVTGGWEANGPSTPEHDADEGEDGAALHGSTIRPLPTPPDLTPDVSCCW